MYARAVEEARGSDICAVSSDFLQSQTLVHLVLYFGGHTNTWFVLPSVVVFNTQVKPAAMSVGTLSFKGARERLPLYGFLRVPTTRSSY